MNPNDRHNLGISHLLCAAAFALLCSCSGAAAPVEPPVTTPPPPPISADSAFAKALRARLITSSQAGEFSGAVLVIRDEKTLFEGAFGLADREKDVLNTTVTQFRVGSMNKMMTAVATLQLVQAGKLRLDEPLGTYLPDYPNKDLASRVTLHHLLTHTGGTGDIFGPDFNLHRLELRTVSDYLQLYGNRGLQFTPGTQWVYSNYGFMLLGAIIERVTGTSYYNHIAKSVLSPAGMVASGFAPEDSIVPGRSVGYMQGPVPGALVSNAPTLPYRGTPAGGGYSTVEDFASFASALRKNLLLDAAHTTMLTTGKVALNPATKYAYGFVDHLVNGRRWVGHNGGAAGMNGNLEFEPDSGYIIVVLSNFDPPAAQKIVDFIFDNLPTNP
jgi:CubicO group peptidase (beta-lactamase class C family)